jgi:hypothetical protein
MHPEEQEEIPLRHPQQVTDEKGIEPLEDAAYEVLPDGDWYVEGIPE